MRQYGMARKSETTSTFIADMNDQGPTLCFQADNGGEFTRWN